MHLTEINLLFIFRKMSKIKRDIKNNRICFTHLEKNKKE